jgi:hypothetical protein
MKNYVSSEEKSLLQIAARTKRLIQPAGSFLLQSEGSRVVNEKLE